MFLVLLTATAVADPAVHANLGPLGEWVGNGRWSVKVHGLEPVKSFQAYRQLKWVGSTQAHFDKVSKLVFDKGGTAWVLEVEFENLGKAPQSIGHEAPMWFIRCDDGQEVVHRGVEHQDSSRLLEGALPGAASVAAGGKLRGKLIFFLPQDRSPRLFSFKAPGRVEKVAGKTESLAVTLADKSAAGKTLKAAFPKAAWHDNGVWKLRLTDYRSIDSMAAYRALPWQDRLSPEQAAKHFDYVERNVFGKGGKVALVRVEFKNLSDKKLEMGYESGLTWSLVDPQGKALRLAGVYQQTIPWNLVGGMAKKNLLNPKARGEGYLGFFVTRGVTPKTLRFEPLNAVQRHHGKALSFPLP